MTPLTSIFPSLQSQWGWQRSARISPVFIPAGTAASFILFVETGVAFVFCSATLGAASPRGSPWKLFHVFVRSAAITTHEYFQGRAYAECKRDLLGSKIASYMNNWDFWLCKEAIHWLFWCENLWGWHCLQMSFPIVYCLIQWHSKLQFLLMQAAPSFQAFCHYVPC